MKKDTGDPLNGPLIPGKGTRGGSQDYAPRRPANGRNGGTVNAFVESALKLWPILVLIVGWAVSVEVRMPKEVPPQWFEREVRELAVAVAKVDAKVANNGEAIARLDGRVDAIQQRLPRFSDGS